jgi:hypothetical protein
MTSWNLLRGLGAPFNVWAYNRHLDAMVAFAPGAFKFDANQVAIHAWQHSLHIAADYGEGQVQLWQNDLGLCWEAAVRPDNTSHALLDTIRRSEPRCSVGIEDFEGEEFEENGAEHMLITSCRLEHIAIAPKTVYPNTRVWAARDQDQITHNAHMADFLRQWVDRSNQVGHRAWNPA